MGLIRRNAAFSLALAFGVVAAAAIRPDPPADGGIERAALAPGDSTRELAHDGLSRSYLVHVPPAREGDAPLPVIFFFHGGTGTAAHAARSYGWNEKADAEGFIVVYPNGTGRLQTWNALHCCGEALRNTVDDVGFVRAVIDDVKSIASIDESRIYATGMSNGAMFAHRLAAEMSDVFAAIAPVAGAMGGAPDRTSPERRPSPPDHPVPVIIVHGMKDGNAPYQGGHPTTGLTRQRRDISIPETARFWAEVNGCDPVPRPISFDAALSGKVEGDDYVNVETGRADVVVCRILEGGHAWPGGAAPARRGADAPLREWSATDAIWKFFDNHPKGAASSINAGREALTSGNAEGRDGRDGHDGRSGSGDDGGANGIRRSTQRGTPRRRNL